MLNTQFNTILLLYIFLNLFNMLYLAFSIFCCYLIVILFVTYLSSLRYAFSTILSVHFIQHSGMLYYYRFRYVSNIYIVFSRFTVSCSNLYLFEYFLSDQSGFKITSYSNLLTIITGCIILQKSQFTFFRLQIVIFILCNIWCIFLFLF